MKNSTAQFLTDSFPITFAEIHRAAILRTLRLSRYAKTSCAALIPAPPMPLARIATKATSSPRKIPASRRPARGCVELAAGLQANKKRSNIEQVGRIEAMHLKLIANSAIRLTNRIPTAMALIDNAEPAIVSVRGSVTENPSLRSAAIS